MPSLARELILNSLVILDLHVRSIIVHYKDDYVNVVIDRMIRKSENILDIIAEAVVRGEKVVLLRSISDIYYPATSCRIGKVVYLVYISKEYSATMYLVPKHIQPMIGKLVCSKNLANALARTNFIREIGTHHLNPVLRKLIDIIDLDIEDEEFRDKVIRGIIYWSLGHSYYQEPEDTDRFIETLRSYGKDVSTLLNFILHPQADLDVPLDRFTEYVTYLPFYHNITLISDRGMLHIHAPVTITDGNMPYSLTCLVTDNQLFFYPTAAYAGKNDYVMGTPILSKEDRTRLTLFRDIVPKLENIDTIIDIIVKLCSITREGREKLQSKVKQLVKHVDNSIFLPIHPLATIIPNEADKLINMHQARRGSRVRIYSPDGYLETSEVKFKLGVEKYRLTLL
ncbi:MAG: hypothetical protein GXO26_02795 [Crenarchaeota archaeon]|nr:hypothetical protein [Thermoproteota archaeon]